MCVRESERARERESEREHVCRLLCVCVHAYNKKVAVKVENY